MNPTNAQAHVRDFETANDSLDVYLVNSVDDAWKQVQQFVKHQSSLKREGSEFSDLLTSVENSLGGLRQEVDAVKQLNSGGSWASTAGIAALPAVDAVVQSFNRRLSLPPRGFEDTAAGSRRSSLGSRYLSSGTADPWALQLDSLSAATNSLQDRIYAAVETALQQTAAAAAASAASSITGGRIADTEPAGAVRAPVEGSSGAAAPSRLSRVVSSAAGGAAASACISTLDPEQLSKLYRAIERSEAAETAATAADDAAKSAEQRAIAAEQLSQQLQCRLQALEQQVNVLKLKSDSTNEQAAEVASELIAVTKQDLQQQLDRTKRNMQQQATDFAQLSARLGDEGENQQQQRRQLQQQLDCWKQQLEQQQRSVAQLAGDLLQQRQQLEQQQQAVEDAAREETLRLEGLLLDAQQDVQELQQKVDQQESTVSMMIQDCQDLVLEKVAGLQLRLQAVEEEQEHTVGRRQQLKGSTPAPQLEPVDTSKSTIADTTAAEAAAAQKGPPTAGHAPAACSMFPLLPDTQDMVCSSTAVEYELTPATAQLYAAPQLGKSTQFPFVIPDTAQMAPSTDAANGCPNTDEAGRTELSSSLYEALREELYSLQRRLEAVESQAADSRPLDSMTVGAVEARLYILEEDYAERQWHVDDRLEQVPMASSQLQLEVTDLSARVEALEANQQAALAAQSTEASIPTLDTPPTVKSRIEQFEEQLNAAISRFAPAQPGTSRSDSSVEAVGACSSTPHSLPQDQVQPDFSGFQQLLTGLQQNIVQLQDKVCSSQHQQSVQQQPAAEQEMQALEDRVLQGLAHLGEQVLQLELQMQQVEDRISHQQTAQLQPHQVQKVAEMLQQLQQRAQEAASPAAATTGSLGAAGVPAQQVQQEPQQAADGCAAGEVQQLDHVLKEGQQASATLKPGEQQIQDAEEDDVGKLQQQQQQLQQAEARAGTVAAAAAGYDNADEEEEDEEQETIVTQQELEQVKQAVQDAFTAADSAGAAAASQTADIQQLRQEVQQALATASAAAAAAQQAQENAQHAAAVEQLVVELRGVVAAEADMQAAVSAQRAQNARQEEMVKTVQHIQQHTEEAMAAATAAQATADSSKQGVDVLKQAQQQAQDAPVKAVEELQQQLQQVTEAAESAAVQQQHTADVVQQLQQEVEQAMAAAAATAAVAQHSKETAQLVEQLRQEMQQMMAAGGEEGATVQNGAHVENSGDEQQRLETATAQAVRQLKGEVCKAAAAAKSAQEDAAVCLQQLQELQQAVQVLKSTTATAVAVADLQQRSQQHVEAVKDGPSSKPTAPALEQLQENFASTVHASQDIHAAAASAVVVAAVAGASRESQEHQHEQQQQQLDELAQQLFELRVEMQNGLCDAERQVKDLDILEQSRKAAAARAEAATADALEKIDTLMTSIPQQAASQDDLASVVDQQQVQQQQLQELKQLVQQLEQQIPPDLQEHLNMHDSQLHQLSQQLQQEIPQLRLLVDQHDNRLDQLVSDVQQVLPLLQQEVQEQGGALEHIAQEVLPHISSQYDEQRAATQHVGEQLQQLQANHELQGNELAQLTQQLQHLGQEVPQLREQVVEQDSALHQIAQQLDELMPELQEQVQEQGTAIEQLTQQLQQEVSRLEGQMAEQVQVQQTQEAAAASSQQAQQQLPQQLSQQLSADCAQQILQSQQQLEQQMQQLQDELGTNLQELREQLDSRAQAEALQQLQHQLQQLQQQDLLPKLQQVQQEVHWIQQPNLQQQLQQLQQEVQKMQQQGLLAQVQQLQQEVQLLHDTDKKGMQHVEKVEQKVQELLVLHQQLQQLGQDVQQLQLKDDDNLQFMQDLQQQMQLLVDSVSAAAVDALKALADASTANDKVKALREDFEEALAAIAPVSPAPSTLSSPGPTPGAISRITAATPAAPQTDYLPRGAWGTAAALAAQNAAAHQAQVQADNGVILNDSAADALNAAAAVDGTIIGGRYSLLVTPEASPGCQQDSAAQAAAAGVRSLAHNGSSVTSRHGMRASIDSLSSPSFKAAAAAAAYENNTYNSFTIGGHEVGWNVDITQEEDIKAASSLAPAAADVDSRHSSDFSDAAALLGSVTARPNADSIAAAAALRSSGLSAPGMGDSAVFENILFDGSSDDEEQGILNQLSARSHGQVTPLMGTPRMSLASSHLLQSGHSQSTLGFAAAAAAAIDDAAEVAASVAVSGSISTPLSVYKNAAFEEDAEQRSAGSSSSSSSATGGTSIASTGLSYPPAVEVQAVQWPTAAGRNSSPVPALSLQMVQAAAAAAAAAADSSTGSREILYNRKHGASSSSSSAVDAFDDRLRHTPLELSLGTQSNQGIYSEMNDDALHEDARRWAGTPGQITAVGETAAMADQHMGAAEDQGAYSADCQQEQQQQRRQRRQWQQPLVPVVFGNLNGCSSDEGESSGYSSRCSSSDGDIVEYHFTGDAAEIAAAAAADGDDQHNHEGAAAARDEAHAVGVIEDANGLLMAEGLHEDSYGSAAPESERQDHQRPHLGDHGHQQQQQQQPEELQQQDQQGSSWMYSGTDTGGESGFDNDDELPVMRIRGGGYYEPSDSDSGTCSGICSPAGDPNAYDADGVESITLDDASQLVPEEQQPEQWNVNQHCCESTLHHSDDHHYDGDVFDHQEAAMDNSRVVLRLKGGAGYDGASSTGLAARRQGPSGLVEGVIGLESGSSSKAAGVPPSSSDTRRSLAGRTPGRLLGLSAAGKLRRPDEVDVPPPQQQLQEQATVQDRLKDNSSSSGSGSGSNCSWKIAAVEQAPLAVPQPGSWSKPTDSNAASNHSNSASLTLGQSPTLDSDSEHQQLIASLPLSSSESGLSSEDDEEQVCFPESAGGAGGGAGAGGVGGSVPRVRWAGSAPPADWQCQGGSYRVALHTCEKPASGTRARASILLFGASGQNYTHRLSNGKQRCSFHVGSTVQDWIQLNTAAPEPAGFTKLSIWHDGEGYRSAWLLDWVLVQHVRSGEWWQFRNSRGWLKGCSPCSCTGDAPAARELQLAASGIAETCPLPALMPKDLQQAPAEAKPAASTISTVEAAQNAAEGMLITGSSSMTAAAASSNPFWSPEVAAAVAAESVLVSCPVHSNNPFDDDDDDDDHVEASGPAASAAVMQEVAQTPQLVDDRSCSAQRSAVTAAQLLPITAAESPVEHPAAVIASPLQPIDANSSSSSSECATVAAAAAAAAAAFTPLDDVELLHRGSPRCCHISQQQQQRPSSPLKRHSNNGSCTGGNSSCSREGSPPAGAQPPSYADHAQYSSADSEAAASVQQQQHSSNSSHAVSATAAEVSVPGTNTVIAAAALCGALPVSTTTASLATHQQGHRRVSRGTCSVKQVPLSSGYSADDECHPGYSGSGHNCISSSSGRLQQRQPTPRASSCDDDGNEGGDDAAATGSADGVLLAEQLTVRCAQQQQQQARISNSSSCSYNGSRPRRIVKFNEWAEQLEFDSFGSSDDSGNSSVESFTEEQLLEAQGGGEFTTLDMPSTSYLAMMMGSAASAASAAAVGTAAAELQGRSADRIASWAAAAAAAAELGASVPAQGEEGMDNVQQQSPVQQQYAARQTSDDQQQHRGDSSSGTAPLCDVPLITGRPTRKPTEYQLRFYTADRVSAGLPSGQRVVLEVLGPSGSSSSSSGQSHNASSAVLLAAELPREKGSFARGCVDLFTLYSEGGDVGEVSAVRVWHEPDGAAIGGGWCLDKLEIEHKFKGVKWRFSSHRSDGCWINKGQRRAVLLAKPQCIKRDDTDALEAEAAELHRQLADNKELSAGDKQMLLGRLQKLQARGIVVGHVVSAGRRRSSGR